MSESRKVIYTTMALFVIAMLLNAYMQAVSVRLELHEVWGWISGQPLIFLTGSAIFFFALLGAASILRNVYGGTFAIAALTVLTGAACYQKMQATGEPLFPWDFRQLQNAGEMAAMVKGMLTPAVIIAVIAATVGCGWLIFKLPRLRFSFALRAVFSVASISILYGFVHMMQGQDSPLLSRISYKNITWNQKQNYVQNGFVIAFASNLVSRIMDRPDGYSKKNVEALGAKYAALSDPPPAASPSEPPNIMFVMNEAYFDISRLDSLKLSEDPLSFLHSESKRQPSGYILSPEFGGGTANVEFEALTGLSNYFLRDGSVPYQQNLTKQSDLPSIVSLLKERGYRTLALHPFDKTFYSRDTVYSMLGFDTFTGAKDMQQPAYLSSDAYISDMAAMKEAVNELKEQKQPVFLHLVTMQNHYPYTRIGIHGANTIRADSVDRAVKDQTETYLEGIKHTDEAFAYLSAAIQELKRPTIAVLWGDHLPALPAQMYEDAGWRGERLRHKTPLLILSNYRIGHHSLGTISPSYLGAETFLYAGQRLPSYYKLLDLARRELPGLSKSELLGVGGEELQPGSLTASQQELLHDYRLIQYDLLEGEGYSKSLMFH